MVAQVDKPLIRLNDGQLEAYKHMINSYAEGGNAADSSKLDPNANVTIKTLGTLEAEMSKGPNIQINRALMYDKITSLFGEELAKEYIRQLEEHEIYTHDESSLKPYCVSVSMYPFLLDGTIPLGGNASAPQHLDSFCGEYINLVYELASHFAGAVATVEFFLYFDYFARKDYGRDYLTKHKQKIVSHLAQVVYSINEPAVARGNQSVFLNWSLFDKHFFEGIFGDFAFPNGDKPCYETIAELQKLFMDWFTAENEKRLLSFPVMTASALVIDGVYQDKDIEHCIAKGVSLGKQFFVYESDTVDSLSSCCFSGDQKVLTRDSSGVNLLPIKEYVDRKWVDKKNPTVLLDGSWVKAKPVKVKRGNKKMFCVTLSNGKELVVTEDHLHPTIEGDVRTDQLSVGDTIQVNSSPLEGYNNELSGKEGLLLGAYLGDGSSYISNNGYKSVTFSLNKSKLEALQNAGFFLDTNVYIKDQLHSVTVSGPELYDWIHKFVSGSYAHTKRLSMSVLDESVDFRRGILEGYYLTDGGNSNRIYSTSKGLIEDIEALCTSIGLQTTITTSDRTDEPVVIRGDVFKRNHPLFCIRWYTFKSCRERSGLYKRYKGSNYFFITDIKEVDYDDDYVYCFEMRNKEEPYFTLPNGVLTHNCRLKNIIDIVEFSYTLGAGGLKTGSSNVITSNLNRLIQIDAPLVKHFDKVRKYQYAHRELMKGFDAKGLLLPFKENYISLSDQYLTLGVCGALEAWEHLVGCKENAIYQMIYLPMEGGGLRTIDYYTFLKETFSLINKGNREAEKVYGVKYNTEVIPGESVGVKFAKWDKEAGLDVYRDCYNSYFYPVEDNIPLTVKAKLHGGEVAASLDGGSALHINLEELPSYGGAKNIMKLMADNEVPYWCVNVRKTGCKDCGKNSVHTTDKCVHCGSTNIRYATRIIGYWKWEENFSGERRKESSIRAYS